MIGLLIVGILCIYFGYHLYWKRRSLPPGPTPYPFFGNLRALKKYGLMEALIYFHRKYGDLYTIWFGDKPVVTFNSYQAIFEAFAQNGSAFSGRPRNEVAAIIRNGRYGIVFTEGKLWKEHRKFALETLRNFGLGNNLMQERVLKQVSWLLGVWKEDVKKGEVDLDIRHTVDIAVGSIINELLFGFSFHNRNMDEFHGIKTYMAKFVRLSGDALVRACCRDSRGILKRLPFFKEKYEAMRDLSVGMQSFFVKQIEERRALIDFESTSDPTDYVEAYFKQQKLRKDNGLDDDLYSDEQLFGCVIDMWMAGQETTTNTLAWLLLYLMTNPEAQAKLHKELDSVIGSDRIITFDDKVNLPYTNCVVAESQRLCNLAPNNITHRITKDVEFNGFLLKQDTIVTPQISTVLYDDRTFPEPTKFIPERFLGEDGKFQAKPELIPFSVGKRSCLGESLARLELYLFTANMFNQFEITPVKSQPPNLVRLHGGLVSAEPYVAHLRSRY